MKVKDILKRYSMASNAEIHVQIRNDVHKFSNEGVKTLIDNGAPVLDRTVGMVKVINNVLTIYAN